MSVKVDWFSLHDPYSPRMQAAAAAVLEGPGFYYDRVWFVRSGEELECCYLVGWDDKIDESDALARIKHIQDTLSALMRISPDLSDVVSRLTPRFKIIRDAYSTWVDVVEWKDDHLVWSGSANPASR